MRALRLIVGLLAGFVCAAVVAKLSFTALGAAWPAYAAAAPSKAYTLAMLGTRLGIAAFLTVVSAAVAVVVAGERRAAWMLGAAFFVVSLPSHLHYVWADYPVWYHAVYLLSLVPLAWLGGRLVPRARSRPARFA